MPELPDITIYVEALRPRIVGHRLESVRLLSPFILRSVDPPISEVVGQEVVSVRRIGKRIAIQFANGRFLLIHLMISGRLLWSPEPPRGLKPGGKIGMAAFTFSSGSLLLTEAGSKKRAAIYVIEDETKLSEHDPGGLELFECTPEQFAQRLASDNRTLKRALTNSHNFSGIGNAYSDEILHAAKLSPLRLTRSLSDAEFANLFETAKKVLSHWTEVLRQQFGEKFPGVGQITAFRPDFAAHGKFGKPCPVCKTPIQRIRYADNETNYCAICQNEGRVLADRALSRLLKDDWPRTVEELLDE